MMKAKEKMGEKKKERLSIIIPMKICDSKIQQKKKKKKERTDKTVNNNKQKKRRNYWKKKELLVFVEGRKKNILNQTVD